MRFILTLILSATIQLSVAHADTVSVDEFSDAFEDALTQNPCNSIPNASFVSMMLDNGVLLNISIDQRNKKAIAKSVTQKLITIDLDFTLSADGKLIENKTLLGETQLDCVGEDQETCATKTKKGIDYFSQRKVNNLDVQKYNSYECLQVVLRNIQDVLKN